MADNQDILDALYAYGGSAPGASPDNMPVGGPLSSPTPNQLPSLAPAPVDPYAGPAQTQANALIDPRTGVPSPVQLGPVDPQDQAAKNPNVPGLNGPDTMSKGEKPQNPYGPAPKPLSATAQGDQDVQDALGNAAGANAASAVADNRAKAAMMDRRANAATEGVQAQQLADQAYLKAQAANNARADSETAQWMQDMEKKSKEEPNPHRYWDNSSGFGKALWILSWAFGAKAQSKGAATNAGTAMFDAEMNSDIARQRDRIGRELDSMKLKGTTLEKRHQRDAAIAQDIHGMKIQRLMSLQQALDMRAQKPGALDDVAAIEKAKQYLMDKQLEVAADKNKYIRDSYQKGLDRSNENFRQGRALAMQQKQLDEQAYEHDQTSQEHYDLAQEKIDAKSGQPDEFHKGLVPIPQTSGVFLKDKTGNRQQIMVSKESAEKVHSTIQNAQNEVNALADLKDSLGDSGFFDRVLNNDPARRQAMAQVIDPLIKQMGGRFNKDTAAALQDYVVGGDWNSLKGRLTGPDIDTMKNLVQKQINDMPGRTREALRSVPSNLSDLEGKGYDVSFELHDTRAPKAQELKGDDVYGTQHVHVKGSDTIDQQGSDITAALPSPLRTSVESTLAEFDNKRPGFAMRRGVQELARLKDYAAEHPDQKAEVEDAEKLISRGMQVSESKSSDHWGQLESALTIMAGGLHKHHDLTADDVRDAAKTVGLGVLPTGDIDELLTHFNKGK